jgi:hypothetical protein
MVDCVKRVKDAVGDNLSLEDIKAIVGELETQKKRILANERTVGKLGELDTELYRQPSKAGSKAGAPEQVY